MLDTTGNLKKKPLKKRGTLFTNEMIAAARTNQKIYPWAKEIVEQTTKEADQILEIGYDRAVELMPSTELWRSFFMNDHIGCPVCGMENYSKGNKYTWNYNEPWKVTCPTCGKSFPSNDFESYYKSGLDTCGNFRYDLADSSLLVNTKYTDRPKDWCVDNGRGMYNDRNELYATIGHCTNNLWIAAHRNLKTLRHAYLYTGKQEYADFAIVILSRFADVYPEFNLDYESNNKTFVSCNGGSATEGKILGRIQETDITAEFCYAYDALFTAFPTISDKALGFIQNHSPIPADEYTDLMVKIEDRLVKEVYPNVLNRNILGNMGMHQASLATAAKCIDTVELSTEWLDFVFKAGNGIDTGGNMNNLLLEVVDRDGFGNEAAPSYNVCWLSCFMSIADILDNYYINGTDISYDLYKNPKMKKMFLGFSDLILSDKYTPHIGDIDTTGTAVRYDYVSNLCRAFTVYGDSVYARAIYQATNGDLSKLHTSIFTENPEQIQKDVKAIVEKDGEYSVPSYIFNGYGFGVLKNRSEKHTSKYPVDTTAAVFFGKNFGHGHADGLNLALYSHHVDIAPDHGTPEYKNATNPHRFQVVNTTLAHNTVTVDEYSQNKYVVIGSTRHFAGGDYVQLIDASSPAYKQCSLYARTVASVKISDAETYLLDFFRVKGGSQHKYSFHTMPTAGVETTGLNLEKQVDENGEYVGTYAGKDVPFATVEYAGETLYRSRGYQWYTHVNKDQNPEDKVTIDWQVIDHHKLGENLEGNLHLKVTMLGKHDEVTLLNGVPPRVYATNPRTLSYVFATNQGEDLESAFVTAFEPYDSANGSQILDISPLSIQKDGKDVDTYLIKAVKVTLKNGRVDYVVCSYDTESTYRIGDLFDFCGYFGVYTVDNGKTCTWMHDATILGSVKTQGSLSGKIVDFTKDLLTENFIKVKFDQKDVTPEMINGLLFKAQENENSINPVYNIVSSHQNSDGTFTLDIGDVTPLKKYSEAEDKTSLYEYNLFENQPFVIPMTYASDSCKTLID